MPQTPCGKEYKGAEVSRKYGKEYKRKEYKGAEVNRKYAKEYKSSLQPAVHEQPLALPPLPSSSSSLPTPALLLSLPPPSP